MNIETTPWLRRGKQRAAVAQVLRQPSTSSQVWRQARGLTPKLQLRDVWFHLRQMKECELICCLNPSLGNGKVFFWTERGRMAAEAAFGHTLYSLSTAKVNWDNLGRVARAAVRRNVLVAIGQSSSSEQPGKCVSEVRRQLRDKAPMELSRAIRAVKELSDLKLVRVAGHTPKPKRKLYELTPAGRRVVEALKPLHASTDGETK